ncbi:hypothetical protein DL98DRAFT_577582 [Cadophora sp. DSE1049]|nr:hypothetical protein DL98DRAFT_577582 [Cadophora sp. DSE1049]
MVQGIGTTDTLSASDNTSGEDEGDPVQSREQNIPSAARVDSFTRRRTHSTRRRNRQHGWEQPVPIAIYNGDRSLFTQNDSDKIDIIISQAPMKGLEIRDYEFSETHNQVIREYVEKLTKDELIYYVRDLSMLRYLSRLFQQQLNLSHIFAARRRVVETSPAFTIPPRAVENFGEDFSKIEYAEVCVMDHQGAIIALKFLYDIALQLREHIPEAASQGLDETSLERMKSKMSALQENFHEACRELRKPTQDLLWEGTSWWGKAPNFLSQDEEPKNIAHAYQQPQGTTSTLAFLVPVLSLISSIPIFLAWMYSDHQTGNTSDANFWQLISGSSMQFLSILTILIPTIFNIRKMAWFWTWILAATSIICAIMAIPLYLYAPTKWSTMLSFVGSVAGAFVTLQLVYTL